MEDFKCQVCSAVSGNFSSLHRHLKKEHGILPRDYYPLFFDRRDLFDGEPIQFKDIRQYFSTNFNSKWNLLKWCAPGGEKVKEYIINILAERADEKGTRKIPGHVELKSLFTLDVFPMRSRILMNSPAMNSLVPTHDYINF